MAGALTKGTGKDDVRDLRRVGRVSSLAGLTVELGVSENLGVWLCCSVVVFGETWTSAASFVGSSELSSLLLTGSGREIFRRFLG